MVCEPKDWPRIDLGAIIANSAHAGPAWQHGALTQVRVRMAGPPILSIAHAPTYEPMDDVRALMKGEASGLHGLRVLIVEDSYVVARAIQPLLEEIGMVVVGPVATSTAPERLLSSGAPRSPSLTSTLWEKRAFI